MAHSYLKICREKKYRIEIKETNKEEVLFVLTFFYGLGNRNRIKIQLRTGLRVNREKLTRTYRAFPMLCAARMTRGRLGKLQSYLSRFN